MSQHFFVKKKAMDFTEDSDSDSDIIVLESLNSRLNYIPKSLTRRDTELDHIRDIFVDTIPLLKSIGKGVGALVDPSLDENELNETVNDALVIVSSILSSANLNIFHFDE